MVQDPRPEWLGLIGHPVGHSRSAALQQAALDACNIAARYALWDTPPAELPARVAALRAAGMLGANVTVPYKLAVVPLLDELAPSATRLAGSVNTIVVSHLAGSARLVGHSTDPAGLRTALQQAGVDLAGRRVVLLGAGGAAHAVAGLLASEGAHSLTVAARQPEAAAEVVRAVARRLPESRTHLRLTGLRAPEMVGALDDCDLLINATSAGMGALASTSPLDVALLARCAPDTFVCDLVYAPPQTALLRAARACGLRAMNGLPMLLHQGAAAFTLWTGQPAPLDVMRAALGLAPTE